MFKIAVIIFRECLEIALLLGVIIAVTKPIKNSRNFILAGVLAGVTASSIFAFFAKSLTEQFDGFGDEIFDAGIILLTSVIISWTCVWMQGYTKKLRRNIDELSNKISSGNASKMMLVLVVATTVLREGAEILLYVYSISSAENLSINDYGYGLLGGAVCGFLAGAIVYKGLIKFAGKYIFKVSTILLILIASGLAAEAAGILTSAGLIELYADQLWDTSWIISDSSITGKLLNIIIGYDSRPNGMQLIFYFSTITITLVMMKIRTILFTTKQNA